jgi:hypothetical protein
MVKVYPLGYNPFAVLALQPFSKPLSREDPQKHIELEKQAVIQDQKPIGQWFEFCKAGASNK